MAHDSLQRLQYLLSLIPSKLTAIAENDFSAKASPSQWSKKEILGHLIDSAANNHQRFIRGQYEEVPVIFYDPDQWVALNRYQQLDANYLIELWTLLNTQLTEVIKGIPENKLSRICNSGGDSNHTLQWLIEDYVVHMEHHLHQLTAY